MNVSSTSLDEISVALAVGGVGLGLFGAGRRTANSMSLIGATLGLFGAVWLTMSMVRHGGPTVMELPVWGGASKAVALSNVSVCWLAAHALIVAVICSREFRSPGDVESSRRHWISAPIVVSSVVLFQDPVVIAGAYLAANVVAATLLESAGPGWSLSRMVGALTFVAAILCGESKGPLAIDGHPGWSIDLSKNWPLVLLGASTVIPLISPVEVRGGRAQRAYIVAAPFFLLAALVVHIGVAPFGVRLSAILSLIAAVLAAWHGWRAFKASGRRDVVQRVTSLLLALAVCHWLNSSSVLSTLAFCAATSAASVALSMALEGAMEGRAAHWPLWFAAIVGACGVTAALGCLIAETLQRAIASPASWTGAAYWLLFVCSLAAATLTSSSIKYVLGGGQKSAIHERGVLPVEAMILSIIALLSGVFAPFPGMFGGISMGNAALARLFDPGVAFVHRQVDTLSLGIGMTSTIIALAAGAALPRRITTRHPEFAAGRHPLVRLVSSPFVVFERIVEGLFAVAFLVFSPRNDNAESRIPSPATIVLAAAVAGSAALLIVHRHGGAAL